MDDNMHREKLLFLYTGALDRGDMTTVSDVLAQAADDPLLGAMIAEIDEAYAAEADTFITHHRKQPVTSPTTVLTSLPPTTHSAPPATVTRFPLQRRTAGLGLIAAIMIALVGFITLIIATNIGIDQQSLNDISGLTHYPVITAANAPDLQVIDKAGRGAVYDVAWSADGSQLALGTATGVYLVDPQTGADQRLGATWQAVDTITYTRDGRLLGLSAGQLIAWDSTTGIAEPLITDGAFHSDLYVLNADPLTLITLSCADADCSSSTVQAITPADPAANTVIQSGEIIATAYADQLLAVAETDTITLWDLSETPARLRHTLDLSGAAGVQGVQLHGNQVRALVMQPGLIADPRSNAGVMVPAAALLHWDALSGELRQTTDVITPSATTFALNPAGQAIYYEASRSFRTDQPQLSVNVVTDDAAQVIAGGDNRRDALQVQHVAQTDAFVATVLADGSVQVWAAETADLIAALDQFRGRVTRIAFSPNDTVIALGDDATLDVWDYMADDRLLQTRFPTGADSRFEQVDTNNGFVFDPDGRLIYTDSEISRASLGYWTRDAGQSVEELGLRSLAAADLLTTDANGAVVAYFFEDGLLVRQDMVTGGYEAVTLADNPGLNAVFAPDGSILAQRGCLEIAPINDGGGCVQAGISLFNTVNGNLLGAFATPFDMTMPLGDLAVSREARTGSILVAASGCADAVCEGFRNGVWDVTAFITGDAATPERVALFDGYRDIVFNADGGLLASIQDDHLWVVNIADERVLLDRQLAAPADALAFNTDGSLLGVSVDGVVHLLGVPVE